MTRRSAQTSGDLLMGTLDLLVLQTLQLGPAHGYSIASTIARRSDDVLQVEQGSLYPALQRLEDRGWISSQWGTSESNRRARFYKLTAAGKRQLTTEATRWEQLARAVKRVMRPVEE
jgi:PadR family transcriptional regulator PadR